MLQTNTAALLLPAVLGDPLLYNRCIRTRDVGRISVRGCWCQRRGDKSRDWWVPEREQDGSEALHDYCWLHYSIDGWGAAQKWPRSAAENAYVATVLLEASACNHSSEAVHPIKFQGLRHHELQCSVPRQQPKQQAARAARCLAKQPDRVAVQQHLAVRLINF